MAGAIFTAERQGEFMATQITISLLTQLSEKMNRVRERALVVALKRLSDLTPAQRAALEQLAHALMDELIRVPSVRLLCAAGSDRESGFVDDARYLFALDERRDAEGDAHGGDARAA
jgi:glutamyl-tRNA reductase